MKISSPPDIPELRWTLIALVIACAWVVFRSALRVIDGDYLEGFLGIAFWVILAAGLWLRIVLARWVALTILWAIVFVIPLGTINPFAAMDELGPYPPPVWKLLLFYVSPWVIPSLFAIHVLGKHKQTFRWRLFSTA
ncbi:hypothetical protein [Arenimonas maotaiensis]|uniref:hypothetical protein n=1 Tax=Arenimonas maotaiensis TaxID=1446479 RepID=UPI00166984C2|nr:hypothetical protein [Arenimonas maotaiensis]